MPKTTTVVVKSFAALIATGLGTLGGFNYVSGGNVWGTGNDFPTLPAPTSISSVAAPYVTVAPQPAPAEETARPATETSPSSEIATPDATDPQDAEQDTAETDGSCCTSTGRAGFLTGAETPAPADRPLADAREED